MALDSSTVLLVLPWFKLDSFSIPVGSSAVTVQAFGLLTALGLLFGSYFARRRAVQLGVDPNQVGDFLMWTMLFGLIAAYVLNAALYYPEELLLALKNPPLLFRNYWGLSSFGGILGALLTAYVMCKRRGLSYLAICDIYCLAFPFAWIFARLGCFVVHDHPGLASDFFLAVDNYNEQGIARHDLGLYEAMWAMVVAPLFFQRMRSSRPSGYFVTSLALLYGPVRFALDFLRAGVSEGGDARYVGLTPGQYFALALTALGAFFWQRERAPSAAASTVAPRP